MMRTKELERLIIPCACMLVLLLYPIPSNALNPQQFQDVFLEQLEHRPAVLLGIGGHGAEAERIDQELSRIYHENGLQPLWVRSDGPGEKGAIIFHALAAAGEHGLDPESYHIDIIKKYWTDGSEVGLARLDILLTLGLGGYVADLREGRINPREVDPTLFETARDVFIDPVALVEDAIANPDLEGFLDSQAPPLFPYKDLRSVLAEYRKIAARGGWEAIPDGETLTPGMEDSRVPLIRKRLALTGDLQSENLSGTVYDEALVEAVKGFQLRHGREKDGVLDRKTLEAMNVPVEKRIRQIMVNMERWRWVSRDPVDRLIVVNIAGFWLTGAKKKNLEIRLNFQVAKGYHRTPIFSDKIKYIVFNPYWNIPSDIAVNEILPRMEKDPDFLKKHNIRLFDGWGLGAKELDPTKIDWDRITDTEMAYYRLRQDPGPSNVLGTIKFVFPNKHEVFLHDIPSRGQFLATRQADGGDYGSIGLDRPKELASYLLGGEENEWGTERIDEVLATGKRTIVPLERPIPVYIMYRTVMVGPDDGKTYFFDDVYGRDDILEKALFEPTAKR